uniref:Uncharacterized protein n=1 Tax=Anguilla anguilla TaxID=7936 RepID=A0A0E9REM2_ANGAN
MLCIFKPVSFCVLNGGYPSVTGLSSPTQHASQHCLFLF